MWEMLTTVCTEFMTNTTTYQNIVVLNKLYFIFISEGPSSEPKIALVPVSLPLCSLSLSRLPLQQSHGRMAAFLRRDAGHATRGVSGAFEIITSVFQNINPNGLDVWIKSNL